MIRFSAAFAPCRLATRAAFLVAFALFFAAAATASAATQIIYVDSTAGGTKTGTSWTAAYDSLSAAITAANPTAANPVEIWIKTGVYKPTTGGDRKAAFTLKNYLTLRGGFAGGEADINGRPALATATRFTVLSGDIGVAQSDAVTATTTYADLSLVTFTQRLRTATDFDTDPSRDNSLNVVRAEDVVGAKLDRVVIAGGCAAMVTKAERLALFTEVFLSSNSPIPIRLSKFDDAAFIDEFIYTYTENSIQPVADGHARILDFSKVYKSPATNRLSGGGLFAKNSSLDITDCRFVGNYAQGNGGAVAAVGGNLALQGTIFVRNVADYCGGAAFLQEGTVSATDNTFYHNAAVAMGGAVFLQSTAYLTATPGNDYGEPSHAGQLRLYEGGVASSFGASAYLALTDAVVLPAGFSLTGGQRLKAGGMGVAKTIASKMLVTEAKSLSVTFNMIASNAVFRTVSLAYAAISAAVLVGDIGVALAVTFGVDPNDPGIQGWTTFSEGFNRYASPAGWAEMLLELAESTPYIDPHRHVYDARVNDYNNLQNKAAFQAFARNRFELNNCGGTGGGLLVFYTNIKITDSWFISNQANAGAGGAGFYCYNRTAIENTVFQGNSSVSGCSALGVAFRSEARVLNSAFLENRCIADAGRAVCSETGGDVTIMNSVLWSNTSGDLESDTNLNRLGGADLFAARYEDLNAGAQQNYADSDPNQTQWLGVIDVQYSNIQSLDRLPTGTQIYAQGSGFTTAAPSLADSGYMLASGFPNIGEGIRPDAVSKLNNISLDPMLLDVIYPHPLSPLINAGHPSAFLLGLGHSDIYGNGRPALGRMDIGPVESDGRFPGNTILYVNHEAASGGDGLAWETAFNNLPSALNAPLSPGGQIWVAEGIYYTTTDANRDAVLTLRPGVSLIGGFPSDATPDTALEDADSTANPTILSGDIGGASAVDNSKALLTGTTPLVQDSTWAGRKRGYDEAVGIPRLLLNLRFTAAQDGVAVTLTAPAVVKNCVFDGNTGPNHALKILPIPGDPRRTAQVIDSLFENNAGGALECQLYSVDILNCQFYDNTAPVGAAIYFQHLINVAENTARIERSVFAGNSATAGRGGAVYYAGRRLAIAQSVFADNTATPAGGDTSDRGGAGLFVVAQPPSSGPGQLSVTNSIFYGNRLTGTFPPATVERQQIGLPVYPGTHQTVTTFIGNNIEGLATLAPLDGTAGNVDYDPFFLDAGVHNYQLADDSMLNNRGGAYVPIRDEAAVVGVRDIGAYENATLTAPRLPAGLTFTTLQPTEAGRSFTFNLPSYTGSLTNLAWEVRRAGDAFRPLVDDAFTSGQGTPTLTLGHPPHTWSGSLYRLRFTDTDGTRRYSETRTLVCLPSFLYVTQAGAGLRDGTSWADASASLPSMISLLASYTQLWIAAGDYDLAPTAPNAGVKIYGGFAGDETALADRVVGSNETRLHATSPRRLFTFTGTATYPSTPTPTPIPTVLDGLTLIGAPNGGLPGDFVLELRVADIRAGNLTITGAAGYGSAVNVKGGTNLLTGCSFIDHAEVALEAVNANLTLNGCTFTNNAWRDNSLNIKAYAGAIYAEGGTLTIADSTFIHNRGSGAGAIAHRGASSALEIKRSRFFDNSSGGSAGAVLKDRGTAKISNSLFARNRIEPIFRSGGAGAIRNLGSTMTLAHLTLVNNESEGSEGAVGTSYGSNPTTLANSIVWANLSGSRGPLASEIVVTNSYVQGAYDPLFDEASTDYALTSRSPMANRGGSDPAVSGTTDLDGRNRFYNGTAADLGASEYSAAGAAPVFVFIKPASQAVFVERPVGFSFKVGVGAHDNITIAPTSWEYLDGSTWVSANGLPGWTITTSDGVSTIFHAGFAEPFESFQLRAFLPAAPGQTFPVTLTVKPRLKLYVNASAAPPGDGLSWETAFTSLGDALAAATGDTDIWVAAGDYLQSSLTVPAGARLYYGFAGGETSLESRNPTANPVRIGSSTDSRTLVTGDATRITPPITLGAAQTGRWQVDRGDGFGFVDLVSDANHLVSVVGGVPTLTIQADLGEVGYHYRVIISDANGDLFTSTPVPVTALPRPAVYVDASVSGGANNGSSWTDAYGNLATALAAYPAFADIFVAEGTYTAPANSSFFLRRGLVLQGGHVAGTGDRDPELHRTILKSPGSATSHAITVGTSASRGVIDATTVLDGFVFTNAGVGLNLQAASPVVRNCRFEGLVAAVTGRDSGPAIETSVFTDQLDSAIRLEGTAQASIADCDFARNGSGLAGRTSVQGAAIQIGDGTHSLQVVVSDSTFADHQAQYGNAAVSANRAVTLEVLRSTFTGNSGGISASTTSTVKVRQSLFARNTGTALRADGTLDLAWSTVADNDSRDAAVSTSGATTIRDSILWGNTRGGQTGREAYQFSKYLNTPVLGRTIIQGLIALNGTALLPFDPRFVDAANGDYRLSADSPALDAGLAGDLLPDETDLVGEARTAGADPDLGALEADLTATAPVYSFGLPAALAAPAGSTFTLTYVAPAGGSLAWQFSSDGIAWTAINAPGSATVSASPPGVTTTTLQSNRQLTLTRIQDALDGISLRAVLTVGAATYESAPIPVTIQPLENLYVDANRPGAEVGDGLTWPTAFKTLSDALVATDATHRLIQIAEGTYTPSSSAPDSGSFRLTSVEVHGGWPTGGMGSRDPAAHPTILTAPSSLVTVRISAGGLFETILDGVTVQNGLTGILVDNASPLLRNLIVSDHSATGLVVTGSPRIENSTFENNAGVNGGGVRIVAGQPVLERVTLRGNTATKGGGVYVESVYGTYTFHSVQITGNVADLGGGFYQADGRSSLNQVTLAGNRARQGAAAYVVGGQAPLHNSIVWGNVAFDGGADPQLAGATAEYAFRGTTLTTVEQTSLTTGFLRFNPLFTAPVAATTTSAATVSGDYSLRSQSAAIDRGDNAIVSGLTLDLAGHPRLVGPVDLGAYESAVTGATPLLVTAQPSDLTYRRDLSGNTFTVAGTGATSIHWEILTPGGSWTTLVGAAGFTGADSSSLVVGALAPSLNGALIRAVLTGADGSLVYSDEKTLTVYSPIYYVNANRAGSAAGDGLTWATAFKTLDEALALPFDPEGTAIWLAAGDYAPASSFMLRPGVSLYGGFAGTESDLDSRDPVAHVTALVPASGSATVVSIPYNALHEVIRLDSLTIRDTTGCGVDNVNNANLAVNRVRFANLGTALSLRGGASTITDSVFTGNQVAIQATQGALTVSRTEFRGNGGAGGDPIVSIPKGTVQLFENCLFTGNIAKSLSVANATLRHVTIANNLGGTALTFLGAGNQLQNSVVWGNRTAGSGVVPAQTSGSIQGNSVGNAIEGVTAIAPVFVSPVAAASAPSLLGDYQLDGVSRLIETGDNTYSATTGFDLAGLARLHGARVEPGAYEYQAAPYFITSPSPAAGAPGLPATFTVSATTTVQTYAWDVSVDDGANWSPLVNDSIYGGTATDTLTVSGDATLAGHLYRARLHFPSGRDLASDGARFDYLSLAGTTTGGFSTAAVFTAAVTGSPANFTWQVSVASGAFITAANTGTTPALSVQGNDAYTDRVYRTRVTFANGLVAFTNAVAFDYVDITAGPSGVGRNGLLAFGTDAFAFDVTGGVQPSSLTDSALFVHAGWSGRLSFASGDLDAPVFDNDTTTLAFLGSLHAGETVTVTTTSSLRQNGGIGLRPQLWEFRNGVVSGGGIFDAASALPGAAAGATAFALADLDGDGDIDAFVGDASGLQVYLNDGLGQFTAGGSAFGGASPVAIALGTLTASGGVDAVVATSDGHVQVWSNNGAGVFMHTHTAPTFTGVRALALGDLDADGDLDLFAACATDNAIYFNNGSGGFSNDLVNFGDVGLYSGVSVALGDINNDGYLDAVAGYHAVIGSGVKTALWINQGNGTFTAGWAGLPGADRVSVADFNGDGLADVALARTGVPTQVWRNQSNGASFSRVANGLAGGAATLATGDVDGDGRLDLVLTDAAGDLGTWAGEPGGDFARTANQPSLAFGDRAALADLDADGALDLFGLDPSGTPASSLYRVVASIGTEDTDLALSNVGFTREGGASVTHARIASLPANGYLATAALPLVPVAVNDTFTLSQAAALIYHPAANVSGFDSFTWQPSTDGGASFGTAVPYWIIIQPVIDAVVAEADAFTLAQGGTATLLTGGDASVLANDTNNEAGTFTATLLSPPASGSLTLNGNGTFSYVHDNSETLADQFVYRAKNLSTGQTATALVSITITNVNDAPASVAFVAGDTLYTGQAAEAVVGMLSATDPDHLAAELTLSLVAGFGDNAEFVLDGATLKSAVSLDYPAGLTRSVRVRATDPDGLSLDRDLTLTLVRAPEAVATGASTDEDTDAVITLSGVGGATTLSYQIASGPAHGSLSGTGASRTYKPAPNFNGSDTFTFTVSDGVITSAPVTVAITINAINDAPVLAPVAPGSTDEHNSIDLTLSGTDADTDAIAYHLAVDGAFGTVTLNGSLATYTPTPNASTQVEFDEFTVYATDLHGESSADLVIRVRVAPVNDAPILAAAPQAQYNILKGETVSFVAGITDYDSSGTALKVGTLPQHGVVTIAADHSFVYRPDADFSGTDSFTLYATDGGLDSNAITVNVVIADPAPVAIPASASGDQRTVLHAVLSGYDPQGDLLTATVTAGPDHGEITLTRYGNAGYELSYTPHADFHGGDSLTFTMSDAGGNVSAPATIDFTVNPVNRAPVASDLTLSQSGLLPSLAVVLEATDADDDALAYEIVSGPAHGTLSGLAPDLVYTPTVSPYAGTDSFTYQANDGTADSALATVSLTFVDTQPAAVAEDDELVAYRGLSSSVDVLANDSDPWGHALYVSAVTQGAHGTVTRSGTTGDGRVTYAHNGGPDVDDQFTYTVSAFGNPNAVVRTVFVAIRDHVLTVTSTADSGPGSLREAIATVNAHHLTVVAPAYTTVPSWTIRLLPPLDITSTTITFPLEIAGASDETLGDSALEITGKVLIDASFSGRPATLERGESAPEFRVLHIAPGAVVTLRDINIGNGSAHQGGGIYNEGSLTLENSTLSGNTAWTALGEPGLGGALFNRNGTVTLDDVRFTGNVADDAAGLYNLADGAGAHVIAAKAAFSGHAPASDFRSVSLNAGDAQWTSGDLVAETPTAPWFGTVRDAAVSTRFSQTVSVLLDAGQTLSVAKPINIPAYVISGQGGSRTLTATFGPAIPEGPHNITVTASGNGVTFRQEAEITVDPNIDHPPIARDDHIAVRAGGDVALTSLALFNDEDPDGTPLTNINIPGNPSSGQIYYVSGMPFFRAGSGNASVTYDLGGGSNTATIYFTIQTTSPAVSNGNDDGTGSLRAGIALANTYPIQTWTLKPSGLTQPLISAGTVGESDPGLGDSAYLIAGDVVIDGSLIPNLVLRRADDAPAMRLFHVLPGARLTLKNLTVENGRSALGGAIYNEGTLILDHAILQSHTATATGTTVAGLGGAIYNAGGTVSVTDSTLQLNLAADADTTVLGLGGAIYTRNGTVSLTRAALINNVSGRAGGLFAEGDAGAVTVTLLDGTMNNPVGRSDVASTTGNGGTVTFNRTGTKIFRVAGPYINGIADTFLETSYKLSFSVNPVANLVLSASSSLQAIVADSGFAFTAPDVETDHLRQVGITATHAGITTVHLIATSGSVSFHEVFKLYAQGGIITNPVAYPNVADIYPTKSVVVDVLANASDPYGSPLSLRNVTTPAHGTATITSDNKILYTHTGAPDATAPDEFFYDVVNSFGGTVTSSVQIRFLSSRSTVRNIGELTAAIALANANPTVPWLITIDAPVSTQWFTSGYFSGNATNGWYSAYQIQGRITIEPNASGFILWTPQGGGPPLRHFVVMPGASLELKNLTLANGRAYSGNSDPAKGGAVLNYGTFSATGVTFSGNSGTQGGAIYSRNGSLALDGVTFTSNTASVGPNVYVLGDGAAARVEFGSSSPSGVRFATLNGGSITTGGGVAATAASAVNDALVRPAGKTLRIAIPGLFANDDIVLPNGVDLVFDATSAGGVSLVRSGSFLFYQADAAFADDDSFSYTITDRFGTATSATVSITVEASAPTPITGTTLSIAAREGGGFVLRLVGIPGRRYTIQVSTDLAVWSELATATADAQGLYIVEDPITPPPGTGRFYRAVYNQ